MDIERSAVSENVGTEADHDIVQSFLAVQASVHAHYESSRRDQQRPGTTIFWLLEEVERFGQLATTGQIVGYPRNSDRPVLQRPVDVHVLTEIFQNALHRAKQEPRS